jgi:hypothetical protein
MLYDAADSRETLVTFGERRWVTTETVIGALGTIRLFAVFVGWPLSGPVVAGATWLHQTIDCAVAGECAALMDRG